MSMMHTRIFGMRFHSNESLQPGTGEIASFLDRRRAPGSPERHRDDLAAYAGLLGRIEAYEAGQMQMMQGLDLGDRMLLGALSHSQFFSSGLRIAVEEYKYHLGQLDGIDLAKPADFIRAAEEELRKLDRKKKEDQPKIARFTAMITQRRKDQDELERRRRMLAGELCHIAVYVRDNLAKVRKRSEEAITRLAALQVSGEVSGRLVGDLKAHFKDQVRDNRDLAGGVTKEYLETLKGEVPQLAQQLSRLLLEDLYAVTRTFEALHDHVRDVNIQIETLTAQAEAVRERAGGRGADVFGRIERVLVALITKFPAGEALHPGPEGPQSALLREKRREMLDQVLGQLRSMRPAVRTT